MAGEIQFALIVAQTEAEGPGRRYAVWVQGCPMRWPLLGPRTRLG